MNVFSDMTKRLMRIDRSAFAELEMLGKNNPNECFDALWAFVTQVAEEWPHVQS